MTASPDILRAISALWEDLTPEEIAAKTAALQARVEARLVAWDATYDTLASLETDIESYATSLAETNTAITAATAQQAAKTSSIATLEASVITLQEQIAEGGPPATAEDIAERDQVNALLTELSVVVP